MFKLHKQTLFLALFLYVTYFVIMPPHGHDYDMGCFARWAVYIYNHGLREAYNSEINYLPGHLYEIKLYTLLFNNETDILNNIYYLKYFTLAFDIAGALLVSSLAKKSSIQQLLVLTLMLNPSYLHNNLIWGQFDSVFSCLAFASFLAISRNRFAAGIILYILSINFKLQAIIFAPVIGLYFLYQLPSFSPKLLMQYLLLALITEAVILIPFMHDNHLSKVWSALKSQSGISGYISLEAANIWRLLMNGDLRWTSDDTMFAGITLKTWGLVMYVTSLLLTLMPFINYFIAKAKGRIKNISFFQILLMLSLSPLIFFFFNTQMHERYSFPAFLFLAAYSFISGNWIIYGAFSLAYFLNNDKLMQCITKMNYNASCFDFYNISLLFLSIIIILFLHLLYTITLRYKFPKVPSKKLQAPADV
jgi:hypothetical protein